jgi:hypothetical protein
LQEGTVLPGVHEIMAPEGTHIVDFVTQEWLPRAPRPLEVGLPELAPGSLAQLTLAQDPRARS